MHWLLRGVALGCLLFVASCSSGPRAGAASKEEFARRFLEAVKSKNVDDLLTLYCWDGVDDDMKTWVIDSIVKRLVHLEATDARYVAVPNDRPTITIKGKEYQSSLEVTGYLAVELEGEMAATMPIGQKGGRYYFAVMAARRGS